MGPPSWREGAESGDYHTIRGIRRVIEGGEVMKGEDHFDKVKLKDRTLTPQCLPQDPGYHIGPCREARYVFTGVLRCLPPRATLWTDASQMFLSGRVLLGHSWYPSAFEDWHIHWDQRQPGDEPVSTLVVLEEVLLGIVVP